MQEGNGVLQARKHSLGPTNCPPIGAIASLKNYSESLSYLKTSRPVGPRSFSHHCGCHHSHGNINCVRFAQSTQYQKPMAPASVTLVCVAPAAVLLSANCRLWRCIFAFHLHSLKTSLKTSTKNFKKFQRLRGHYSRNNAKCGCGRARIFWSLQ